MLPGLLPIGDGGFGQPGLRIVMRNQLWLRLDDLRELCLHHLGNALMVLLAGAPRQGLIGRVLDQGMFEAVGGARWPAPLIEQFRRNQLSQPCLEGNFVKRRQGLEHSIHELPAQHRPQLGHGFRRSQAIQAGHQGIV